MLCPSAAQTRTGCLMVHEGTQSVHFILSTRTPHLGVLTPQEMGTIWGSISGMNPTNASILILTTDYRLQATVQTGRSSARIEKMAMTAREFCREWSRIGSQSEPENS